MISLPKSTAKFALTLLKDGSERVIGTRQLSAVSRHYRAGIHDACEALGLKSGIDYRLTVIQEREV